MEIILKISMVVILKRCVIVVEGCFDIEWSGKWWKIVRVYDILVDWKDWGCEMRVGIVYLMMVWINRIDVIFKWIHNDYWKWMRVVRMWWIVLCVRVKGGFGLLWCIIDEVWFEKRVCVSIFHVFLECLDGLGWNGNGLECVSFVILWKNTGLEGRDLGSDKIWKISGRRMW